MAEAKCAHCGAVLVSDRKPFPAKCPRCHKPYVEPKRRTEAE